MQSDVITPPPRSWTIPLRAFGRTSLGVCEMRLARIPRHPFVLLTRQTYDEKGIMTKEEIRKRLDAKPFVPFHVKIAGGGQFEVPTPDHAHLHPSGRTLFIHL